MYSRVVQNHNSITWVRWEAMHMINNSGIQNTLLCISHTHLTALFPGLPRCVGTRKVKPIWILLKQKTVSGSGISWTICKSAPRFRQITTPAPHHSSFLQAGCCSCRPTNSVKALKAYYCVFHSMKINHWRYWRIIKQEYIICEGGSSIS